MANVLIVDDDSDTVECSRELLESAGHKIQTGYNGEDGLKSLDAGPLPDCILLDVDMPVLNGPGMAHQMLLHDAGEERIPILLVSGSAPRGKLRTEFAHCERGQPTLAPRGSDPDKCGTNAL